MFLATPFVNLCLKSWIFPFSLHVVELGRRAQLTNLTYGKGVLEGRKKSSVYLVCWLEKGENPSEGVKSQLNEIRQMEKIILTQSL